MRIRNCETRQINSPNLSGPPPGPSKGGEWESANQEYCGNGFCLFLRYILKVVGTSYEN